jgi:hypothetical protein
MVVNRARQEIIWIAPNEKIPKVAQTTGTVYVFDPRSGILGPTSACPNPTRSPEMPSCSAID